MIDHAALREILGTVCVCARVCQCVLKLSRLHTSYNFFFRTHSSFLLSFFLSSPCSPIINPLLTFYHSFPLLLFSLPHTWLLAALSFSEVTFEGKHTVHLSDIKDTQNVFCWARFNLKTLEFLWTFFFNAYDECPNFIVIFMVKCVTLSLYYNSI